MGLSVTTDKKLVALTKITVGSSVAFGVLPSGLKSILVIPSSVAVGSSIEVLETVEVAVASNVVGFVVVSIAESELEVSCSSESVLRSGDSEVANSPSCS